MKVNKTYSTRQAAAKMRVSFQNPKPMARDWQDQALDSNPHAQWTDAVALAQADIAKGRKVKAAQKPGPKPKAGKR